MAIDTNELIRQTLRRIATKGDLLVLDAVYRQYTKYHLVGADGRVGVTYNEEFGKRLWKAAQFWGLTSTKRYTRRGRSGLCVAIANDELFLQWLAQPSPELPQEALQSDAMPICALCGSPMDVTLIKPLDMLICATCRAEVS